MPAVSAPGRLPGRVPAVRRLAARLLLGLLLVAPGVAWANDAGFVPGIDDMPLMPGLQASADSVVFDKPTGRIVQARAVGHGMDIAAVRDFYHRTLPALGWHEARDLTFVREGERLKLDIRSGVTAGEVDVRFDVAPR